MKITLPLENPDASLIPTAHPIAIMMMNESLNADEALFWLNQSFKTANLPQFADLKCQVFRGCWNRETYLKIAVQYHRDHDYIREVGAELLQQLSQLLGERVTKQNLRTMVEKIRVEKIRVERSAVGSAVVESAVGSAVVVETAGGPLEAIPLDTLDRRSSDWGSNDRRASSDRELMNYDPTFLGRDEDVAAIDRKWHQER